MDVGAFVDRDLAVRWQRPDDRSDWLSYVAG